MEICNNKQEESSKYNVKLEQSSKNAEISIEISGEINSESLSNLMNILRDKVTQSSSTDKKGNITTKLVITNETNFLGIREILDKEVQLPAKDKVTKATSKKLVKDPETKDHNH